MLLQPLQHRVASHADEAILQALYFCQLIAAAPG